jgi:hypothetical protein
MNGKDFGVGREGSHVVDFGKSQLVHYYEAIKRDRMYDRGYELRITQYINQAGQPEPTLCSLHCIPANGGIRQPSLARFWSMFREIEEEAIGFLQRNRQ